MKFHTKYLTKTGKEMISYDIEILISLKVKSSYTPLVLFFWLRILRLTSCRLFFMGWWLLNVFQWLHWMTSYQCGCSNKDCQGNMPCWSVLEFFYSWWHHQMETFSVLLALCEGNPLVTCGFCHKASDTELSCFLDLHLNKWLSKQLRSQWIWDTIMLIMKSL